MAFPKELRVFLTDEETETPISGVVFIIKLFAKKGNDFYIVTDATDPEGKISMTDDHLANMIHSSSGLEYPLDNFKSLVMIWIMSDFEFKKILEAHMIKKSNPQIYYGSLEEIKKSKNHLYELRSTMYEFHGNELINVYFTTRQIK
jgi:hypothetical protein